VRSSGTPSTRILELKESPMSVEEEEEGGT